MDSPQPPCVGEPVVQQVLLCDVYRRPTGHRGVATSLPGHLLQLTIQGRTEHEVEGRQYRLGPGHLVWFFEDELVRLRVEDGPWSFYTLNFLAPALQPPPFEHRVCKVSPQVARRFARLLRVWRSTALPPAVRELHVHGALAQLLAQVLGHVMQPGAQPFSMDSRARLWWELESRLRQDLAEPVDLAGMQAMTGRSGATIARACHAAVRQPPMRRLKQIRLSLARGLVRRSSLTITEIASRVGYLRLHEFSRDYHHHFGLAPRADRAASRGAIM